MRAMFSVVEHVTTERARSRRLWSPGGAPSRYRSLRSPCARTEKAIHPTPSESRTLSKRSSIQRLNIEYEG